MSKRLLMVAVLLAAALAGHWAYWYSPREHTGSPRSDRISGALFLDSRLPNRLWLPYPHQNAGALEGAIDDPDAFIAALSELGGKEVPRLPAFGSFRLPPSSEIAVATDSTGRTFVAVARVYPIVGLLARWAGRLAGNPLLAGGEAELDGRPVKVQWRDGSWIATAGRGVAPDAGSGSGAEAPEAALGWVELATRRGNLPAGRYRLDRAGEALELTSGKVDDLAAMAAATAIAEQAPLVLAQGNGNEEAGMRVLALLDGIESLGGLPGAVTFQGGAKRWRLPGESLLKLVGDGPPRERVGAWKLVALEQKSLERGRGMVPELDRLRDSTVGAGAWIRLSKADSLVNQVVAALEAVPIIGERQARRWRALSTLLDPLIPMGELAALVDLRSGAVYVRLGHRQTTESD
jgi:hypothetical protein